MQHSTTSARALTQDELRHSRYQDALIAFRTHTGLRMDGSEGGSGGDGAGGSDDGDQGGSGDQGGQQGSGQQSSEGGSSSGKPISEMTDKERADYFEKKARTEENRRKDVLRLTGGRYGDDLKSDMDELEQFRAKNRTQNEQAIEDAKKQTRAELAAENVRAAFDLVLPDDMPEEKKTEALGVLNLAAFLTPDGKVDTAKVKTHAATLAPAKDNGQQQRQRDWGGGHRQTGGAPLGAAGLAEAERRFSQKKS